MRGSSRKKPIPYLVDFAAREIAKIILITAPAEERRVFVSLDESFTVAETGRDVIFCAHICISHALNLTSYRDLQ